MFTFIKEWWSRRQAIKQGLADNARRRELRLEWEAKQRTLGPEFEDAWVKFANTPLVEVATLNERWLRAHPECEWRRIVCQGSIGRLA